MGSAYLKHVSPQHPLSVAQLPRGYVFNSLKYSQPSLTTQQAARCNYEMKQHVYAQGWIVGQQYLNPGLGDIEKNVGTKRLPFQPPPPHKRETVGEVTVDQNGVVHPPPLLRSIPRGGLVRSH